MPVSHRNSSVAPLVGDVKYLRGALTPPSSGVKPVLTHARKRSTTASADATHEKEQKKRTQLLGRFRQETEAIKRVKYVGPRACAARPLSLTCSCPATLVYPRMISSPSSRATSSSTALFLMNRSHGRSTPEKKQNHYCKLNPAFQSNPAMVALPKGETPPPCRYTTTHISFLYLVSNRFLETLVLLYPLRLLAYMARTVLRAA